MACAIAGAWRGVTAFDPVTMGTLKRANPNLDFEKVAAGLGLLAQGNRG
jgi:hypothetical protein